MNNLKTTNTLLLFIVIPLVFYLLKILSFIFIPLTFSMFLALLFFPVMRVLSRRNVPKVISIIIVVLIIAAVMKIGGMLIRLASHEIISSEGTFVVNAENKLTDLLVYLEKYFGVQRISDENIFMYYLKKMNLSSKIGNTLDSVGSLLSMTMMTVFFALLWLLESINFQKLMNQTILKQKFSSIKTFMKIEKDILTFVKVKVLISFLTGLSFSISCLSFGVSFPIFWGLFAFVANFIQMIGSILAVILLALFAFVELDSYTILAIFTLILAGIQLLFGSVIEPLLMGRSFSISVIAILIMLMLWGFIWGIPGMILAIPITVFIKIVLEQFPGTQFIADIIGGQKDRTKK